MVAREISFASTFLGLRRYAASTSTATASAASTTAAFIVIRCQRGTRIRGGSWCREVGVGVGVSWFRELELV